MKTLLNIIIWFAIFAFVTGETDPMVWGTTAKVLSILILLLLLNSADD